MFERARKSVSLLLLPTMVLTACQDAVFAPKEMTNVSPRTSTTTSARVSLADRTFPCYTRERVADAPEGYRSRSMPLYFPAAALASDRSLITYSVRTQADELPSSTVNCIIPRTAMAIDLAHKAFGIQSGAKVRTRDRRGQMREGTVGIRGCVTDGLCLLETLEVVAEWSASCPRGDCWRGGVYGGEEEEAGGGGSTGGSPSAYDQGPLAWVACIGAGLVFLGGAAITYVTVEQYYKAIADYGSARLRYEHNPSWENYSALVRAEENVNLMTIAVAGSATISVGALLGIVVVCSPGVLLPTP